MIHEILQNRFRHNDNFIAKMFNYYFTNIAQNLLKVCRKQVISFKTFVIPCKVSKLGSDKLKTHNLDL